MNPANVFYLLKCEDDHPRLYSYVIFGVLLYHLAPAVSEIKIASYGPCLANKSYLSMSIVTYFSIIFIIIFVIIQRVLLIFGLTPTYSNHYDILWALICTDCRGKLGSLGAKRTHSVTFVPYHPNSTAICLNLVLNCSSLLQR